MSDHLGNALRQLRNTYGCMRALERRLNYLAGRNWYRSDVDQVMSALHHHAEKAMEAFDLFAGSWQAAKAKAETRESRLTEVVAFLKSTRGHVESPASGTFDLAAEKAAGKPVKTL